MGGSRSIGAEEDRERESESETASDGTNVPLWFMLFEHLSFRVVADDSDVDECAQVELLCAEGCVRHDCVVTAEKRSERGVRWREREKGRGE
jgi:hypothetical protein